MSGRFKARILAIPDVSERAHDVLNAMPDTMAHAGGSTPVRFPSFHDGRLTSIAVADGNATLGLRTPGGAAFELRLAGVERFRADNVLEGNIILRLEVVRGRRSATTEIEACLAQLFPPPHPNAGTGHHVAYAKRTAEAADRIMGGDALLVSVQPSYGCDLVALCSECHLVAKP